MPILSTFFNLYYHRYWATGKFGYFRAYNGIF